MISTKAHDKMNTRKVMSGMENSGLKLVLDKLRHTSKQLCTPTCTK